nr:MAG TPA: hypothetical protein [Caudoviricetes sp.]DAQ78802.1 MAG TPA: hypothetical protein [Caudoviricetes sp.]
MVNLRCRKKEETPIVRAIEVSLSNKLLGENK